MAEACANCGRADLMQADVRNYQCLACGALTDMATHQVVPTGSQPAKVSATGAPVVELSSGGTFSGSEAGADDPEHRLRPGDPLPESTTSPAMPEITPAAPVPVLAPPAPEPTSIDLTALTPEQIDAIELIAHAGGEDGEAHSGPA